ncbi:hypothetical protein [Kribbella sp. NPDC000426]|uniref:hypothetical protein n=1 Tax=Kribbella sp. NPDC000426 TaxID=3154255 RepID=UPI00332AA372
MKLLTRLAALVVTLVLSAVALPGTAFAMQPRDPSGHPAAAVPSSDPTSNVAPSIVHTVGPSTLQVIGLMLCAAVIASVLTAFVLHRPAQGIS